MTDLADLFRETVKAVDGAHCETCKCAHYGDDDCFALRATIRERLGAIAERQHAANCLCAAVPLGPDNKCAALRERLKEAINGKAAAADKEAGE